MAFSWILVFVVFLDENFAAIILVSELFITHLDEHVVIHLVGSTAFEFSGDSVLLCWRLDNRLHLNRLLIWLPYMVVGHLPFLMVSRTIIFMHGI